MLMTAHLGHFFSAPVFSNSLGLSVLPSAVLILYEFKCVCVSHRYKLILFSPVTAHRTSFLNHDLENLATMLIYLSQKVGDMFSYY